jgi:tetratricopeptide (TPR) repeat protein
VLAKAELRGIRSNRLLNLKVEALRAIPAPVALSVNGRMDYFGYAFDGAVARDPKSTQDTEATRSALDLLARADSDSLEILLNRGHGLLSIGKPADALADFKAATKIFPENPLGWLGTGIANFMLDDHSAAETAFRRCLELSPDNDSAAVNLAMILDEQGKSADAAEMWRRILQKGGLSEKDRGRIRILLEQRERK